MRTKFTPIILGLALSAFMAVGANATQTITLSELQITRLGILVQASLPADDAPLLKAPAKIIPARTSLTAITVPFEGVLTRIHILPSQYVKAGETLFTIRSRDYLDMKIGLDGARSELEAVTNALVQQQKLVDEGLSAGTSLLPLKAAVTRAKALVDEHREPLRGIYGAGSAQYYIKAPDNGRIENFDLQVGQNNRSKFGTHRSPQYRFDL